MKRISALLPVLLVVLTVAVLLGSFPATASAAETLAAPSVSVSNVASTGKVKLTWDAVDGAMNYEVYRSTSKNGTYTLEGTTANTQYVHTGAVAGETYYYKVKAIAQNPGENSAFSAVKARTCDLARTTVTVSNKASSGKIVIKWNAVKGATKYQLYRATSESGPYTRLVTTSGTTITNTSAVTGETYYYKVRAVCDVSAATAAFSGVKARTCDLPRPVTSVSNVASSGKVRVTWDAIDGAVKYQIYRATSENGTYTLKYTTSGTKYTNTDAVVGKTYYYKVKAIAENSSANSAYSSVKARTCDLAQPVVTVSQNGSGKPKLSWATVSSAVKYQVYRAESKSGTYSLMAAVKETGYTDTDAVVDQTYYYKVRAICGVSAAASAYSDVVSGKAVSVSQSGYYYVNTNAVTLYKSASSSASSIRIPYMAEVQSKQPLPSVSNKWCEVTYNGSRYYVWLADGSDKFTAQCSDFNYKGNNKYQQEVLDLAMTICQEWDTIYAHSQSDGVQNSDGTYGFDCSGFASYVINTVMKDYVPAYRLTANLEKLYDVKNIYNEDLPGELNAVKVPFDEIQPGDVLFFETDGVLGHCGIYLGNGEFVHSTSTWNGVCIMPLAGSYTERFLGARRYLPEGEVQPANTKMVLTSGCKLYEDRSGEGDYLMRLSKGTTVTVLYTKTDYTAYVRTADGTCGFVWAKYLSA